MPKPQTSKLSARKVREGHKVRLRGQPDEVVRRVSVILHLANGMDVPVSADDEVTIVEVPEPEVEDD